jgi:hypothetical protein
LEPPAELESALRGSTWHVGRTKRRIGDLKVVALAYFGYGLLVLILAGVAGTYISGIRGRANPAFGSPGFILTAGLVFGVPCYFIGSYLRSHGDESFSLLILVIAAPIGFILGLANRAQP